MSAEFRCLLRNDEACSGLAAAIAGVHRLGLPEARIRAGSNILYILDEDHVLKVFSREEHDFRNNEALFLRMLHGRLPVEVPGLIAVGEHDEYPYLIMQRITGSSLDKVWESMDAEEKLAASRSVGILLKELHSLPSSLVEGCVPVWGTFIRSQNNDLAENHAGYGLEPSRIREVVEFVDQWEPVEEYVAPVICHTEIMREHLFVGRYGGGLRLSGLIDFEPSMLAVPQYDLCAAGLFMTSGDPGMYGALLDSYGSSEDLSVETVTRMLLLHRYSNMNRFMSMLPGHLREADILTMGEYWFSGKS